MNRSALIPALAAVTFWGTGNLAIKLAVQQAPPITLAGARAMLGGAMLVAVVYVRGGTLRMPRSVFRWVALIALIQVALMPSFFYVGIQYTTLSVATIIIGTTPIQVALVEHFTSPSERLTPGKLLGLVAGLTGLIIIFWHDLQHEGLGSLAGNGRVLVSSILFTSTNLIVRRISDRVDTFRMSAIAVFLGSIPALAAGLLVEGIRVPDVDSSFWLLLLYIAVMYTAVPYVLWFRALSKDAAGRVAIFMFLVPVWGVLLGIVVLDERLDLPTLFGGLLVVLGIMQVTRVAAKSRTILPG